MSIETDWDERKDCEGPLVGSDANSEEPVGYFCRVAAFVLPRENSQVSVQLNWLLFWNLTLGCCMIFVVLVMSQAFSDLLVMRLHHALQYFCSIENLRRTEAHRTNGALQ